MNPPSSSNDIVAIYKALVENVSGIITVMKNGPLTKGEIKTIKEGNSVILAVLKSSTAVASQIEKLNTKAEKFRGFDHVKNIYNGFFGLYKQLETMTVQMEQFKFRKFRRMVRKVVKTTNYVLRSFNSINRQSIRDLLNLQKLRIAMMSVASVINSLALIKLNLDEFGILSWLFIKVKLRGLKTMVEGILETVDVLVKRNLSPREIIGLIMTMNAVEDLVRKVLQVQMMMEELKKKRFYSKKLKIFDQILEMVSKVKEIGAQMGTVESLKLYIKMLAFTNVVRMMVEMTIALAEAPMLFRIKRGKAKAEVVSDMILGIQEKFKQISLAEAGKTYLKTLAFWRVIVGLNRIMKRMARVGLLGIFIAPLQAIYLGLVDMIVDVLTTINKNQGTIQKALKPVAILSLMMVGFSATVLGLAYLAIQLSGSGQDILSGMVIITGIAMYVGGICYVLSKLGDQKNADKTEAGIKLLSLVSAAITVLVAAGIGKVAMELAGFGPMILMGLLYFGAILVEVFGIMLALRWIASLEKGAKDPKSTLIGQGIQLLDLASAALTVFVGAGVAKVAMDLASFGPKVLLGLLYFGAIIASVIGIMLVLRWVASLEKSADPKSSLTGKGIQLLDLVSASLTVLIGSGVAKVAMDLASFGPKVLLGLLYFSAIIGMVIGIMFILRWMAKSEGGADLKSTMTARGIELFSLIGAAIAVVIGSGVAKVAMELASFGPKVLLGLLYVSAIIGMLIGLMFLLRWIAKVDGGGKSETLKGLRRLGLMTLVLLGVVVVINLLSLIMISNYAVVALGLLLSVLVMMAVFLLIKLIASDLNPLNRKGVAEDVFKSLAIMTLVAIGLVPTVLVMALLGALVGKHVKNILLGMIGIALIVVAMAGICWVLGKVSKVLGDSIVDILIALAVMVAVAGALVVITLIMMLVTAIAKKIEVLQILKVIGLMIGVVAMFAILGAVVAGAWPVMVALIAGIAVVTGVFIALLLTVTVMKKMSDLGAEINPDDIKSTVDVIVESMQKVIEGVANINIIQLQTALIKIERMRKIAKKLGKMAKTLRDIADLKFTDEEGKKHTMQEQDFKRSLDNSKLVLTTLLGIFVDPLTGKETRVMKNIELIDTRVKRKVRQLYKITKFIGKMAATVTDVASMRYAVEWNADGKPTKYKAMTGADFVNAALNAGACASTILGIFSDKEGMKVKTSEGEVTVPAITADRLDVITNKTKRKMRQLAKITDSIGKMATVIESVANMKVPIEWDNEGKATKFRQMQATEFAQFSVAVGVMVKTIVTGLCEAIKDGDIENIKRKNIRKMKKLMQCGFEGVSSLIDNIVKLSTGQFPMMILDEKTGIPEYDANGNPKMKYLGMKDLNIKGASENIGTMLKTFLDSVGGLFTKGDYKKKAKKLRKAMGEGIALEGITSIIDTIIHIGLGQFPIMALNPDGTAKYDDNGNPIMKYKDISQIDVKGASNKIASIYSSFIDSMNAIFTEEVDLEALKKNITAVNSVLTGNSGMFKVIESMINNVGLVTDVPEVDGQTAFRIKMIAAAYLSPAELFADPKVSTNVVSAVEALYSVICGKHNIVGVISKMASSMVLLPSQTDITEKSSSLNALAKAYKGFVEELQDPTIKRMKHMQKPLADLVGTTGKLYSASLDMNINNIERSFAATGKFVEKLNSVSDSKLEKMSSISKNMADFAKKINGNFDKLADAMNEKMVTALNKVDKTLKEVNKTMNSLPGKLKTAVSSAGSPQEGQNTNSNSQNANNKGTNTQQKASQNPAQKGFVTGKTINNCIVAVDGGYAIAMVQKDEL